MSRTLLAYQFTMDILQWGLKQMGFFVYYKAFPMPVLSYKFDFVDPISGMAVHDSAQFISSVCWRGRSTALLAANSSGNIKLLEMV